MLFSFKYFPLFLEIRTISQDIIFETLFYNVQLYPIISLDLVKIVITMKQKADS